MVRRIPLAVVSPTRFKSIRPMTDNTLQQSEHAYQRCNRPFPSSPGPLFQNEGRCSAFYMEIISHSHTNKTHFHKKGGALSLILKVRVFGTRKWLIAKSMTSDGNSALIPTNIDDRRYNEV